MVILPLNHLMIEIIDLPMVEDNNKIIDVDNINKIEITVVLDDENKF